MIRNFIKADLYFASGAPGENMKIQQTNHFVVDCILMFSSGARLIFVNFAIHSVEAQNLQWPETQNNTFRPSGKKCLQIYRLKEHRLCFSNSLYMQNITKKLVLNHLVDFLLLLNVCTPCKITCFYRACCLKAMFTTNRGLDIYYQQHVISDHVFKFASDHIRCHKNKFYAENAR
jgi:hypothetical protein